ncbi:hypothetical protein L6R50_11830 [Myxococcota bacterium]|nr:hypothetical protein [Myxococcota bacterium]
MRKLVFLCLAAACIVSLSIRPSLAASRTLEMCFELNLDFVDGDWTWLSDDYLDWPGPYPAIGVHVRIESNETPGVLFNGKLEEPGLFSREGCTPLLSFDDDETYLISIWSYAAVNGNSVYVYNNPTLDQVFYTNLWTAFDPTAYPHLSTVTGTTVVRRHWNILGAAIWALHRNNAGMTGKAYKFYDEANPECAGSCVSGGEAYIKASQTDRKYVISHEMGHLVQYFATSYKSAAKDYDSRMVNCFSDRWDEQDGDSIIDHPSWLSEGDHGSHEMNTREYQSAAATEGMAHFYAAASWNRVEQDCWFGYYVGWVDWNLDRIRQADEQTGLVDCANGHHVAPWIEDEDYYHNRCWPGLDANGNVVMNRGTEYDWLRFWWDMAYSGGLSVDDVFTIWAFAGPYDWNANDDGSPGDDPSTRLQDAAGVLGFDSQWTTWAGTNGVTD